MASPWEKYAPAPTPAPTTESGPWANYAAPSPAPTPVPSSVSVPTGDWRTQAVESDGAGDRKSRITSPSDAAMFLGNIPDAAGKSVRAVGEGVLSLPSLLANMISVPLGAGADLIGGSGTTDAIRRSPTGGFGFFGNNGNAGTTLADMAGLPKPENNFEEQVSSLARGTSGAATGVGLGGLMAGASNPVVAGVGETLQAQPAAQVISGGTGALAGELTHEGGEDGVLPSMARMVVGDKYAMPVGETIASLMAGSLPFALNPAARAENFKTLVRGNSAAADKMQKNISLYSDSTGVTPTLGQAAEDFGHQVTEAALTRIPGSNAPLKAQMDSLQGGFKNKAKDLATSASPNPSTNFAGRQVRSGVEDWFTPKARATQKKLYDELDAKIDPTKEFSASNYLAELEAATKSSPSAQAQLDAITPAMAKSLKSGADKDLAGTPPTISPIVGPQGQPIITPGTPPKTTMAYQDLKDIRSKVGEKLSALKLGDSGDTTDYKKLYGALSRDMEAAARESGAGAEFGRANRYTSALHDRFDTLNSVIEKSGGSSRVYQAIMGTAKEDHEIVASVLRSIPKEGRNQFASTVANRLGRSVSSAQNAEGTNFSVETFLTNWDKIAPASRKLIFGSVDSGLEKDLNQLAQVAAKIRNAKNVSSNSSGTAGAFASANFGMQLLQAGLGGSARAVFGLLGSAVAANKLGKVMTNPRFVRWLSKTTAKDAKGTWPAALNNLTVEAMNSNDPDMQDVAKSLKSTLAKPLQPATTRPAP